MHFDQCTKGEVIRCPTSVASNVQLPGNGERCQHTSGHTGSTIAEASELSRFPWQMMQELASHIVKWFQTFELPHAGAPGLKGPTGLPQPAQTSKPATQQQVLRLAGTPEALMGSAQPVQARETANRRNVRDLCHDKAVPEAFPKWLASAHSDKPIASPSKDANLLNRQLCRRRALCTSSSEGPEWGAQGTGSDLPHPICCWEHCHISNTSTVVRSCKVCGVIFHGLAYKKICRNTVVIPCKMCGVLSHSACLESTKNTA